MNLMKMNPPFDKSWMNLELTHQFAGNGFAIAQLVTPDYVRLVPTVSAKAELRCYLAWTKMLEPFMRPKQDNPTERELAILSESQLEKLRQLRNELALGQKTVQDQRIVAA